MDHAERPARRRAVPDVVRERRRLAELARCEERLDGEVDRDLAGGARDRRDGIRARGACYRKQREHGPVHAATVALLAIAGGCIGSATVRSIGSATVGLLAIAGGRIGPATAALVAIAGGCIGPVALLAIAGGCIGPASDEDGAFYDWDDRTVHCAVGLDDITQIDEASIDAALDRARDRGEVVELYAHSFERSVAASTIDYVLAGARERGLAFVTYGELARDAISPGPALALSFDDNQTQTWIDMRDLLARYDARVTFFISRYARITDEQRGHIRQLATDGHGIEAHSVAHLRAPRYVEDHGLAAYLSDEALPSIELLRADGYDVTTYAYPFGARTDELDGALLQHVTLLRSISFTFRAATSPCP